MFKCLATIHVLGFCCAASANAQGADWPAHNRSIARQGHVGPVPLWLQAHISRSSGQTDYQGCLQGGGRLTPYAARTGRRWTRT